MSAPATTMSHRERELAGIISAYNEVTVQLKNAHDALGGEVRKLRVELEDKNRELARRERLSALGEMATGVAHEIRNPLGSIQLYASLLDRDLSALPESQKLVRKISAGVHALDRIVGEVLDFAGRCDPDPRVVALEPAIRKALEAAGAQAHRKNVELRMDSSLGRCEVWADPTQFEQAILNLVLNGIDAVESGGKVHVAAESACGDRVRVQVSDNGPGIGAQTFDRIFNPFFTTKDSGTGLGLAIVHRIVEAHGGRVTARNREEGGACFTLELPASSGAVEG